MGTMHTDTYFFIYRHMECCYLIYYTANLLLLDQQQSYCFV